MPTGLVGPYSASITRLATIVGSANGRSMIASTSRLPGKSSRVSTQATSSPKTKLITATTTEIVSVTRNDSMAALEVMACQNACQPPPADCHTIAASGSSTMTRQPVWRHRPAAACCRIGSLKKPRGARPSTVSVGEFGRVASGVKSSCHPVASL